MPITFAASNVSLQEANESFYRDPSRAPEFVLCALHGLDLRVVFQDDALALRALLDNYHPVQMEKNILLLQKNPPPMRPRSPPNLLGETTLKFRQAVENNRSQTDMIWIEAQFKLTLLGKLRAWFYKPPSCTFVGRYAGTQTTLSGRFLTTLGPVGAMINPDIASNSELLRLYLPREDLHDLKCLAGFAFTDAGFENYFADEIRIKYYLAPPPVQTVDLSSFITDSAAVVR
jgi:hypothetical protein